MLNAPIELPRISTGRFSFGSKAAGNRAAFNAPHDDNNDTYLPYLDDETRIQIFYGGSSSGKSVFLCQRAVLDLLNNRRNYLICRAVARTIRHSVFAEIEKVIDRWDLDGRFSINRSDMSITCDNDYQILFAGLDDVNKLKSVTPKKGAFTDIWVEEATEAERDDIKQLFKRQRGGDPTIKKRFTFSFNPILQSHHIYEDYFKAIEWADDQTTYEDGRLSILKTTYKDNRFLTPDDIIDLESETDTYFYNVYTLGNWGVLGDVIFTNWEIKDLSAMRDQFTNKRNGLDFGFSSDPAAMPVMHYDRKKKTLYIYDELYEYGLTNDVLARRVIELVGRERVVCDSAEPKSIEELRQHGVNAVGAKKGPDSVMFGIQWMQQQRIVVDKRCIHARNEFQTYQWAKDKNGNSLRRPIDRNNHIIDGARYGCEDDMIETPPPAGEVTDVDISAYKTERRHRR